MNPHGASGMAPRAGIPVPLQGEYARVRLASATLATRANGLLALGLAMMALALLLDRVWLAPWRERIALAEAAALARPAQRPAAPRWPPAAQAPQRTADLLQRALRQGLQVQRSRERVDEPGASLVLEMQALGRYGDLRRFLAHALADDTALALESLQVQRQPDAQGRLRIELRWRLLHQARPEGTRQ